MNSQYINHNNQSTVDLKHVLQAEERNKTHAHDGCGCGKDLCLFA